MSTMARMAVLLCAALAGAGCAGTVDAQGEQDEPSAAAQPDASRPSERDGNAGPDPGRAGDGGSAPDAAALDAAAPDGAAAAVAPVIAEQKAVAVLWIEVDKKTIGADVKTPGRLKVFEDPGDTHDGLAARLPPVTLPIGIAVRGNYTRGLPKKPYSLELRDGAGAEKPAALLGLPPEADWVLDASYTDHTFLRNPLTYSLAQEMGRYASRFRFVEIYIDGAYQGLYILLEKPNRDRYRVNIPKPAPTAAEGDLTGGYIFRLEGHGKGPTRDWRSAAGTLWTYSYPTWDAITPAQRTYLHDTVNRFEALMASAGYADRVTGYPSVIDVPSFVDYSLIQEFSLNGDAYWNSARLHKKADAADGKLYAGPIWDFDNAYGMAGARTTGPVGTNSRKFWERLMADPSYRRDLKCRWIDVRTRGPITMENIDAKFTRWAKLIEVAHRRENARWKLIGMKVAVVVHVGPNYDSYFQYLRNWIVQRLDWLDKDFAKIPGACDGGR